MNEKNEFALWSTETLAARLWLATYVHKELEFARKAGFTEPLKITALRKDMLNRRKQLTKAIKARQLPMFPQEGKT